MTYSALTSTETSKIWLRYYRNYETLFDASMFVRTQRSVLNAEKLFRSAAPIMLESLYMQLLFCVLNKDLLMMLKYLSNFEIDIFVTRTRKHFNCF